jgi:hypothetical protein
MFGGWAERRTCNKEAGLWGMAGGGGAGRWELAGRPAAAVRSLVSLGLTSPGVGFSRWNKRDLPRLGYKGRQRTHGPGSSFDPGHDRWPTHDAYQLSWRLYWLWGQKASFYSLVRLLFLILDEPSLYFSPLKTGGEWWWWETFGSVAIMRAPNEHGGLTWKNF